MKVDIKIDMKSSIAIASLIYGTLGSTLNRRLIGTTDVVNQEYPFQALLINKLGGIVCSATLYTEDIVLTAAECLIKRKSEYKIKYESDYERYQSNELLKKRTFKSDLIKRVKKHELYKNDKTPSYNIAVILLNKEHASSTKLIKLNKQTVSTGQKLKIIGWGNSEIFKTKHYQALSGPGKLRKMELTVNEASVCFNHFKKNRTTEESYFDTNTELCAGNDEKNKGIDDFDLGGPLFSKKDGKYYLSGITSWFSVKGLFGEYESKLLPANKESLPYLEGIKNWDDVYTNGYPKVFVDVSKFADWIDETVRTLKSQQ